MSRLIIVSNRLAVTVKVERGDIHVTPSAGGLATGLRGPHEKSDGLWVGWPGDTMRLDDAMRTKLDARLKELRAVPIHLTQGEVARFYDGYSNGVLWPLFHYLLDRVPVDTHDWDTYRKVNERFADEVAKIHQPGDLVWVQDYQLTLVPGMLRKRVPDARIGYFLHIPFPSSDVFRTLPRREEILSGILGADLVGFHAFSYLRHFTSALLRVHGLESQVDRVNVDGRDVSLGVFPMGIDVDAFRTLARDPEVTAEVETLRAQANGEQIVLGVDRLDYTKGIPRRLLAIERLFEREPSLRGRVRFVQIAVPSRTNIEAYSDYRRSVDELVGHINGAFGSVKWTPVQYIYRSVPQKNLVALYRAADVMLVTPLRDGMNLVAKEFVASREDEDGALVLSEFAGAAEELGGDAILVNPYDVDGVASSIKTALKMPKPERQARMRGLRARVIASDVHAWVTGFVDSLEQASHGPERAASTQGAPELIARLAMATREARPLALLLDYDGTLVPFRGRPELATPDDDLVDLLRALTQRPHTRVDLVSGRTRASIEGWFGALPIGLHAEHGFWSRDVGGEWIARGDTQAEWKAKAREVLDVFAARTRGAFVEEKTASIAWHYRGADPEFGALQAKELRLHLASVFSNAPVEVIVGNKVIELRSHGMNKGAIARAVVGTAEAGTCILAIGDDRTDEDMFAALPADAFTAHVGRSKSAARYRIGDFNAARAILRSLL